MGDLAVANIVGCGLLVAGVLVAARGMRARAAQPIDSEKYLTCDCGCAELDDIPFDPLVKLSGATKCFHEGCQDFATHCIGNSVGESDDEEFRYSCPDHIADLLFHEAPNWNIITALYYPGQNLPIHLWSNLDHLPEANHG